jgi:predicted transcriptional regulator
MLTAAETIRTAGTRAGVSQSALAKRAGIAQSTVSRIENDDLDPTWTTMQSLLGAAGWAAEPIRIETQPSDWTAPTIFALPAFGKPPIIV